MFLLTWFITEYSPIQNTLDRIFSKIDTDNKWKLLIFDNLYILLTCNKCLGFTMTLIITLDIYSSIIVAILGQVYELKIKN